MSRDSIHVTMTAQLRSANVRQRLAALAGNTGLPVAQIAGRALAVGLGHLEGNPLLIFPAAPMPEQPTAPAADTVPAAAAPTMAQPTAPAADTAQPAAPAMPEQPTAPAAMVKAKPTPRADRPTRVSSKDAAAALGKSPAAFAQHLQRHPELRRHCRKSGRSPMWDLASLRAEWGK